MRSLLLTLMWYCLQFSIWLQFLCCTCYEHVCRLYVECCINKLLLLAKLTSHGGRHGNAVLVSSTMNGLWDVYGLFVSLSARHRQMNNFQSCEWIWMEFSESTGRGEERRQERDEVIKLWAPHPRGGFQRGLIVHLVRIAGRRASTFDAIS